MSDESKTHRLLLVTFYGSRRITATRHSVRGTSSGIFGEQSLNRRVSLGVAAFADLLIANIALLVDQVDRRPVALTPGVPGCAVIVLRDRERNVQPFERLDQI